jgi:hypothetical protein
MGSPKGLELVTYTDDAGDDRAAVAVCPQCYEACEFSGKEMLLMPRRPKTKALEEALERLQHAREDFAQAFEGILSQLDLSPIEQTLADWR